MPAFNIVRFKVKPGREAEFVDAHRSMQREGFVGFERFSLVQTGTSSFCLVGQWKNFDNIVAARPQMISVLDNFRDMLEELPGGIGVTDPVSGSAVIDRVFGAPKAKAKAKAKAKKKTAKKTPVRKARKPARKAAKKKRRR